MEKLFVNTNETPIVNLEVLGDLRLKGWDELQVSAKNSSPDDLTLEQSGEEVTIHCKSDCTVRVPRQAKLMINAVHGDAVIKGLEAPATITLVHGDLILRGVGETFIQTVYGNLTVKNAAGSLNAGQISGNAALSDVQGDVNLSQVVGGNLTLDDLGGNASAFCRGNLTMRVDPVPGQKYKVEAGGNAACYLPPDASIKISIPRANKFKVSLPSMQIDQFPASVRELTLGEGDADLELSIGGNVLLAEKVAGWDEGRDFAFDYEIGEEFENLAETIGLQIEQQVEAQMQALEQQLEFQMENLSSRFTGGYGMSEEQARRVEQRAREASERAQERTQEKIRRAQEKLQRKIEESQRKAEHKARMAERRTQRHAHPPRPSWGFTWPPTPPSPPTPPGDPVTEDERLVILHMLEQKKISLEEAESLLSALEGRGS